MKIKFTRFLRKKTGSNLFFTIDILFIYSKEKSMKLIYKI